MVLDSVAKHAFDVMQAVVILTRAIHRSDQHVVWPSPESGEVLSQKKLFVVSVHFTSANGGIGGWRELISHYETPGHRHSRAILWFV